MNNRFCITVLNRVIRQLKTGKGHPYICLYLDTSSGFNWPITKSDSKFQSKLLQDASKFLHGWVAEQLKLSGAIRTFESIVKCALDIKRDVTFFEDDIISRNLRIFWLEETVKELERGVDIRTDSKAFELTLQEARKLLGLPAVKLAATTPPADPKALMYVKLLHRVIRRVKSPNHHRFICLYLAPHYRGVVDEESSEHYPLMRECATELFGWVREQLRLGEGLGATTFESTVSRDLCIDECAFQDDKMKRAMRVFWLKETVKELKAGVNIHTDSKSYQKTLDHFKSKLTGA